MRKKRPRPGKRRRAEGLGRGWLRAAVEAAALLSVALVAVIAVLGYASEWFSGAGLWSHLLPFALCVLALGVAMAVLFRLWLAGRRWLMTRLAMAPALLALAAAVTAGWLATRPTFHQEVANLRTLVGGTAEAERQAIAHQVYAAYRRSDLDDVLRVLERSRVYEPTVREAAEAFAVDPEVLMGVAATESSFYPRDSGDGGHGLFQLTAVPKGAEAAARRKLLVRDLDPLNQRHNAFVAAATFHRYLGEMGGDLFLGLLAYNIGPRNGGLRSIMNQYGARDFVTIQPYLQNLPRDYPIRVLSAALAYRIWHQEGRLPHYEEASNAAQIQEIGIPGLQPPISLIVVDHP